MLKLNQCLVLSLARYLNRRYITIPVIKHREAIYDLCALAVPTFLSNTAHKLEVSSCRRVVGQLASSPCLGLAAPSLRSPVPGAARKIEVGHIVRYTKFAFPSAPDLVPFPSKLNML